jgi:hypothetical protein
MNLETISAAAEEGTKLRRVAWPEGHFLLLLADRSYHLYIPGQQPIQQRVGRGDRMALDWVAI